MKVKMDKAIVEFYPETPEEIAGLEALWIKMGNCTGDNKKLAPIGTYVPSENKMARFFIEGLAASELPEPEVRAPVDCEVYCFICNRTQFIKAGEVIPMCCGRRMEIID